MPRDLRSALIDFLGAGIGGVLALAVAGWPDGRIAQAVVALAGGLVGVLAAYFAQRALEWRADAQALRDREAERDQELASLRQLNMLLEHRAAVAKAEAGINAIHMKVLNDAFIEAQKTGHFLPLSAILARIEVMQTAQGLDQVVPPPDLNAES